MDDPPAQLAWTKPHVPTQRQDSEPTGQLCTLPVAHSWEGGGSLGPCWTRGTSVDCTGSEDLTQHLATVLVCGTEGSSTHGLQPSHTVTMFPGSA
jgi:hypothetical protein